MKDRWPENVGSSELPADEMGGELGRIVAEGLDRPGWEMFPGAAQAAAERDPGDEEPVSLRGRLHPGSAFGPPSGAAAAAAGSTDAEARIRRLEALLDEVPATGAGHPTVRRVLLESMLLHADKNRGYRSRGDTLANFRTSAPVKKGLLTPEQYAMVLCAKQDDAAYELLWEDTRGFQERGGLSMLRERLMDGIVYRALIIALVEERG